MDDLTAQVKYVAEDEWYRDFWAVEDTSAVIPSRGHWDDVRHPTIALCDSEDIAKRVAELVNGDEKLAALVRREYELHWLVEEAKTDG